GSVSAVTSVLTVIQVRPADAPYSTRGKVRRPSPKPSHGPVALPASNAKPPSSTGPGSGPPCSETPSATTCTACSISARQARDACSKRPEPAAVTAHTLPAPTSATSCHGTCQNIASRPRARADSYTTTGSKGSAASDTLTSAGRPVRRARSAAPLNCSSSQRRDARRVTIIGAAITAPPPEPRCCAAAWPAAPAAPHPAGPAGPC